MRGATTVDASGRCTPSALNSMIMPLEIPNPVASPISEATRPITRPSSFTERMTCLREAPRVRSVANSRVRWATVIESVLKITNAPTSRAIAPKPSRNSRIFCMPSFSSAASSLACLALSLTSRLAGTRGWIALTSSLADVPCFAAIEIAS